MRDEKRCCFELLAYSVFASFFVGAIFYLFYYSPVNYTFLISEDYIAEYGTSVSFGLAGIILLVLSTLRGPKVRRVIWMLIGVVALVIAAEEISWGQRIFSVDTPGILSQHNIQKEITLHNLAVFNTVNQALHTIVSYLILMYLVFSMIVLTSMPRLEKMFTASGLPLIHLRLIPVFLLAPYFFIFNPTVNAAEFGELFLGVAVLMWAVDLYLVSNGRRRFNDFTSVLAMADMLILSAIISWGLADRHSLDLSTQVEQRNTLNLAAARDFPVREMYQQAQSIYDYIYQHPQYLGRVTRINHGKMLLKIGQEEKAVEILSIAAKEIEAKEPIKTSNSRQLRRLGIIYKLQMQDALADNYFDKSIVVDRRKLDLSSDPDEKADILWSISRTMQERGDLPAAISYVEQAIEAAQSSRLHFRLGKALKVLEGQ